MAKVLKKIVHNQLIAYISNNGILAPVQSGFRKIYSTTTSLLQVSDEILRSVNNSQIVILTLLDLIKAFDLLQHDILLVEMKYYNFTDSAIKLFNPIYPVGNNKCV